MIYKIFQPAPVLDSIIDYYWYISSPPGEMPAEQYFYTPLLQAIAFNFKKQEEQYALPGKTFHLNKSAYLFGQGTGPRIATSNEVDYLCVKFKPLGIAKITGINMEHITDQIIDLDDLWGQEAEHLWDAMQSALSIDNALQILEGFLIDKYLKVRTKHNIHAAQNALTLMMQAGGNIDVKTLQSATNTTRKTLERAFSHHLGMHPKMYSRIVRFNAVKNRIDAMVKTGNMTSLALEFGFYDSSHFIAEFKYFSGLTPLVYLKNNFKDFTFID